MIRYVIDASAAVEYLLHTPLGAKLADLVQDAFLLAPQLLDVEVLSVLRRAVLRKRLDAQLAWLAIEDLRNWPIDRIEHTDLLRDAWRHIHNVSAYDAFYVAAARAYDATLLTADGPLTRAPALDIVVHNIRMG